MQALKTFAAAALACLTLAAPAFAQSPAAHDPAIGVYRFTDEREVYVEYLPDIDGLAMMEFPSGRIRPLRTDGPHAFSFGPTIGQPEPVVAQLELVDGRMHWSEGGRNYTIGQPVAFRTEDVALHNGGVTLAGTLTLPRGGGRHPAIVLIHGGGAQTRDFFWITHFFAMRGFAVLAYDKRGAGQSTGDWRTATFEDLAGDALAAVDYLRTRRDIRANRIGLYGSSAGGWVAPIAAARAPTHIAFVIARSASALPERQNIIYEAEGDQRSHNFGDAEVSRMRTLHDLAIAAHDQSSWNALRTALSQAHGEPWFDLARLPAELPPWDDAHQADIQGFIAVQHRNETDPASVWARLHMPVLIQIGGIDRYVPGPDSRNRLAAALASNRNANVWLYPRGDHPMFESTHGYERDIPGVSRYADGYLRDLDAFLRRMERRR